MGCDSGVNGDKLGCFKAGFKAFAYWLDLSVLGYNALWLSRFTLWGLGMVGRGLMFIKLFL